MSKLLYTISLIFFIQTNKSFSQDWSIFQTNQNYFFEIDSGQNPPHHMNKIAGLRIDSITISNTDSIFHTSPKQETIYSQFAYSCDSLHGNYFGHAIIGNTLENIIINHNFDSLRFPKFSNLSSIYSWNVADHPNDTSLSFVGNVIKKDTITINHQLDSAIFFLISKVSSITGVDSSKFRDTLILSKSHGFIKTYNWLCFPDSSVLSFSRSKFNLLYKQEIFNFNVGDEFHTHYTTNSFYPYEYNNIKILSKSVASSTITYIRDIKKEIHTLDHSTFPPIHQTTYNHFTDTLVINNLNQIVGWLPYDPSRGTSEIVRFDGTSSNPTSRHGYSTTNAFYYDSLYNAYCPDNRFKETTYIEGCGSYDFNYWYHGGGTTSNERRLIYYKKGSETWGTPRIITNDASNLDSSEKLLVYPSPVKQTLYLELNRTQVKFQLIDLNGRTIRSESMGSHSQIDVSGLENGIYFLVIQDSSGKTYRQKIIKQ